jgi:hypothetical protein
MRAVILAIAATIVLAAPAWSQHVDPQSVMDELLRRYAPGTPTEVYRPNRRRDYDDQYALRYRRLSSGEIMMELRRYCPNGKPPCSYEPPQALLQEAANRGLIEYIDPLPQPRRPSIECTTVDAGDGLAITECD